MKKGKDIAIEFPGLYLVHHNLPGKSVDVHHHEEHLLFIPLHGECKVILENQELTCSPGRMIYLPSNQKHSFKSSDMQGERLIAMIHPKVWSRLKGPKFSPRLLPLSQLIKELLFYLLLHPTTKNSRALIETLVTTLCESLEAICVDLNVEHLESTAKDPRIQSVLRLFRDRLEEPLPMTEIAKRSGLSVRSLNRLFLEQLSMTPKQVLSQYRVSKAKELLLDGASVTDACFSVGYQSLTQFISIFRQLTGQLPSEFSR